MKHYLKGGEIYAFEADGSQDAFIPSGAVLMPPAEVEAHLKPRVTPEQVLASLPPVSHAQIIAALILAGIITETEGVAWISGTLPDAVEAMIATLPADQRVIARLRAIRPSSVVPTDPLVAALAAAQGQGVADLIALLETAAAL